MRFVRGKGNHMKIWLQECCWNDSKCRHSEIEQTCLVEGTRSFLWLDVVGQCERDRLQGHGGGVQVLGALLTTGKPL